MTKSKIFYDFITNILSNFDGQLLKDTELKNKYTSAAGGVDCLLRVEKTIFLMAFKWDKGVMSVNNVNLFFKASNVIMTGIKQAHPDKDFNYVKLIVSRKPVSYPDMYDQSGNQRFYNICLNAEDISDFIPDEFEHSLMDKVGMRLYHSIANYTQQYPGIKESDGDIRMAYNY
jgi:hypothetical protein